MTRQSQRSAGISEIASTLARMLDQKRPGIGGAGQDAGHPDDRDVGGRRAARRLITSMRGAAPRAARRCPSTTSACSSASVVTSSRSVATWPIMYMPSSHCAAAIDLGQLGAVGSVAISRVRSAPFDGDPQPADVQLFQPLAQLLGGDALAAQPPFLGREVIGER